MGELKMPMPNISEKQPCRIGIEYLRFDLRNPRYSPEHDMARATDVEVIEHLMEKADLGELIQSIASNGYIDIEPMIVTRTRDAYTVLEGNRRLAAIKLLKDPDLARECGIATPPLTEEVAVTLNEVTVYAVADRLDAREFIGFKHINGPHRWDALSKARYAAEWYQRERENGVTLRDIARSLGDRHDTVKRLVYGIFVLYQAKDARLFDISDRYPGRPFAFSHLYTALTRSGYREYLGLPLEWRSAEPTPNPVTENHFDNLRRVLLWLYGSKTDNVRPVILSQNPHVKQLSEVLEKPKARMTMEANNELEVAYAQVRTPVVLFGTALINAHQNAEEALGNVDAFEGNDDALMEYAKELTKKAQIIFHTMTAAKESHKKLEEKEEGK